MRKNHHAIFIDLDQRVEDFHHERQKQRRREKLWEWAFVCALVFMICMAAWL